MDSLRCVHCRDVIGVYEPIRVLLTDGTLREGSRLTLGEDLGAPGTLALHESCHPAFERGSSSGGAY
jgi:hypothetical protein